VSFIVVLVAAFLLKSCFPSAESQIRRQLAELEALATISEPVGQLEAVGRARRLGNLFAENAEVRVEGTRGMATALSGRKSIMQAMLAARSNLKSLKVRILDTSIRLNQEVNAAIVEASVQANADGEGYSMLEEIRFDFILSDEGWLIVRVVNIDMLR